MLQRLSISYRRLSFASLPVHFLLCSGRRLRCSSPLCSPSLPYGLTTPTQPTPPQQPCYCPPFTRNCSWGIPTLQSAVTVRDAVSARGWARHPWHKQQRRLGGVSLCFCHRQQQQQQQHTAAAAHSSCSSSSSACSSVLWFLRAFMTRIADISHSIASFTVSQSPLLVFGNNMR